jgi:hypothetical protein
MSVYRKAIGVAALGAACILVGASYQSWKGMLVAQPALTTVPLQNHILNLTDFRECVVLVEGLPDALKDSLTREDIEKWTANRLKNMGIRVVSEEDRVKTFRLADKSTDEKMLAAADRFGSVVYINVSAVRIPTGVICAHVTLEVHRRVFIHPGYFTAATVWDRRVLMYFGSLYDPKERIRDALNKLLDLLEKDWKQCNP